MLLFDGEVFSVFGMKTVCHFVCGSIILTMMQ